MDNNVKFGLLLSNSIESDGTSSLVWENNEDQGAWGSEGRIKFFIQVIPLSASFSLTAGVRNIIHRVNCNHFVENNATYQAFVMGDNQNIANIRTTVPAQYIVDFNRGLAL